MWRFSIDVGGTFTDVVATSPKNEKIFLKVLSSGKVKYSCHKISGHETEVIEDGSDLHLYTNYNVDALDSKGDLIQQLVVVKVLKNKIIFNEILSPDAKQLELFAGELSPILAIRQVLKLSRYEEIPKLELRLGTTRGTNALLERKGARCAWVTTKGFGDILKIGDQTRPNLFSIEQDDAIDLTETVLEIEERVSAEGEVLTPINVNAAREGLQSLLDSGIDSLALSLIHSYKNSIHEELLTKIALELGFSQVSPSYELCRHIHFLDRSRTVVLDAYLSPVIKDYLNELKGSLKGSDLYLMDSAGGLKKPENFTGKDSILSGPAGGVVAVDVIANMTGTSSMIGFDMGGTSTDVCRWSERVDLEKESFKAGLKIVTPSLAIETVAAGGGSICSFDGQRLKVGPESAGSDPGPACYGKGGPLCVTDINVWLNRVHVEHFPFRLDRDSVRQRLEEIKASMLKANLQMDSIENLARQFLKLANFTMAQTIRKVSSQKGFTPESHTLTCFGGAGAQHAAELADELSMKKVLIHPLSGVLSAWGIGEASLSEHYSESCRIKLDTSNINKLSHSINSISEDLMRKLNSQGALNKSLVTYVECEIKTKGIEGGLFVEWVTDSHVLKESFIKEREQCFGFKPDEQRFEIVSFRIEVVAKDKQIPLEIKIEAHDPKASSSDAIIYRSSISEKDTVKGPVLIVEDCSSTYLPEGWSARLDRWGSLILERFEKLDRDKFSDRKEALGLEIFTQQFTQIASRMGDILQKTSRSVNVKERMDFSCAILDNKGSLVVNAPHIPVHLGAMGAMVESLLEHGVSMNAGDSFLTNDPYLGGSHLPDLTLMTPVFDKKGEELLLFVASRAHHSEMGGVKPGSCYPFASNLEEEGVVLRHLKICDKGVFLEDVLRKELVGAKYPSRNPDENIFDIKAAMASNHQGAKLLQKLIADQSWSVVKAYLGYLRSMSKDQTEAWIKTLEDGSYKFSDKFDDDSKLSLRIDVNGDKMKVDFEGTGAIHHYSQNATPAIVNSAILYSVRCMMGLDIPLNQGVLEAIEVCVPEETFLNPQAHQNPKKCSAVVAGNVEVSQKIVDVFLAALSRQAASQGTMNNVIFGNQNFGYYETLSGGFGASYKKNGASGWHSHMTNTKITDVEILELRYPVRVLEHALRPNSGGEGKFKGGDGIVRKIMFLEDLELSLLTQRRKMAPFGLKGGRSGEKGMNLLINGQEKKVLKENCSEKVLNGSILQIETPGGGGFGVA